MPVKLHKHDDEPRFRYVISGDLAPNGVEYGTGDWVTVPVGVEYDVSTIGGYATIAGYGMSCECSAPRETNVSTSLKRAPFDRING
ncbi:hypothetical protein AGR7A_pAt10051 [Agrobacterium deltaense NCPPB 1641]|uniref:Cupin 2 conserved barrel domain-containing protein n=1 Tax=Agrobacterium deltaense NCPPB 1641 TaxID=1183425 RepID=A0A1S7U763_9HYPH|nr:hypothetical protein AGR7A_pAt10051 [Agrobacterium deltaense NCPPB 1641]